MSLYQEWEKLLHEQTDATFEKFWEEYSKAEIAIYTHLLTEKKTKWETSIDEICNQFEIRPVMAMGFLDGIQTSLTNEEMKLDNIKENDTFTLNIDFEKLFYNMIGAKADHLYSIDAWADVLSEDKRASIYKDYKRDNIVVGTKAPGRNEPCPCGSGKKYKKCCGKGA